MYVGYVGSVVARGDIYRLSHVMAVLQVAGLTVAAHVCPSTMRMLSCRIKGSSSQRHEVAPREVCTAHPQALLFILSFYAPTSRPRHAPCAHVRYATQRCVCEVQEKDTVVQRCAEERRGGREKDEEKDHDNYARHHDDDVQKYI